PEDGMTTTQATDMNDHVGSISISHDEDGSANYVISGKAYHWDDLTDAQRARLSLLNRKISHVEKQLAHFEDELEPLIEEIEKQAEKIEYVAEILEVELAALEDVENMTIKQIHEISSAVQKKVRAHEKEIRLHEVTIHKNEAKIHALENEFLGKEHESVKRLDGYVDEVVEILTNG
ncbi:MAG: hypothetical protein HKP09_05300, partial [Enterobacterales bacterium]|nr:hypothetical protein [Enterobacterales bacterium]